MSNTINKLVLLLQLVMVMALSTIYAQNPVQPTPTADRDITGKVRQQLDLKSNYHNYPLSNIGPTIMSGRVTDIEVNPDDPSEFYVAYASGGLWHTVSNGTSFSPIFDDQSVMTIGAIDVHWPSRTIIVGTGEVNSSRSSYAGNGVYKSSNNGKDWEYLGLPESHHIGRIHIFNPNKIIVAVLGHLYSPNPERGVFMSNDGGKTWEHTLYVDDNSGAVDLVVDPMDDQHLYTATWHRERRAWNFVESGEGSGIYESKDGGANWTCLTDQPTGFPMGEGVGRIGLDIGYSKEGMVLYALLDNYNRRPKEEKEEEDRKGLKKDDFKTMNVDQFGQLDDKELQDFLNQNGFPEKYSSKKVKTMVADGEISPVALAEYLEDANSLLFDTDVIGAELYVSRDGGKSFTKTHEKYINGLYNSYGYYFGQVRTEPTNPDIIYIMGVPILRSEDGGKNWKNINGENVHVDHHELWINPNKPEHIINGNDGGVNISYDRGETWIKCNTPAVGQFYYINVDNAKPYNVYAGAQDNGVWKGSSNYESNVRWHQSGKYPYESLMGGDGMQVQIDNRDPNLVYTGFQFGNYFRINTSTGDRTYITPKHNLGNRPYRWNWQTPILLSSHNQDIVYMGSNKLLRSMDKGDNFTEISGDLSSGGIKGDVAYGTIVTIDESKQSFGKIVVGTDDGNIHITKDGGHSWKKISNDLPQDLWVTRVQFCPEDDNTIYASLNGYRWDDFAAYLYKSTDDGDTWKSISSTLPTEPINVVKIDPSDSDILIVGTDHGLYASIDAGYSFQTLAEELPNVAVHDVVIHEGSGDLLIGTHGRSIYKLNLDALRESKNAGDKLMLVDVDNIRYSERWGRQYSVYSEINKPSINYTIFSASNTPARIDIGLADESLVLHSISADIKKGVSQMEYDGRINENKIKDLEKILNKDKTKKDKKIELEKAEDGHYYLPKGKYQMTLNSNGMKSTKHFEVK